MEVMKISIANKLTSAAGMASGPSIITVAQLPPSEVQIMYTMAASPLYQASSPLKCTAISTSAMEYKMYRVYCTKYRRWVSCSESK